MRNITNLFYLERYKKYELVLIGNTLIYIITLNNNDNFYRLIEPFIKLSSIKNIYITIVNSIDDIYYLEDIINLFDAFICFIKKD